MSAEKKPDTGRKASAEERISYDEIRGLLHENAERGFIHPSHSEDMQRFHYMLQGDPRALEDNDRNFIAEKQGRLSDDPVKNYLYLFIVNTGLTARFAIEAGVPLETAYAASDLYIRRADAASNEEEIKQLNRVMFSAYFEMVKEHRKKQVYSKPVMVCLNYIDSHFNERITLRTLADASGTALGYLAELFKKEKGETIARYITRMRVETAKALLCRTEYTFSQIALSLGFCSQSHFIRVFRKETGYTPRQYRLRFYAANISAD